MELTNISKKNLASQEVRMKIAIDVKTSLSTISRWIRNEDERLTQLNVIKAISKHTGLSQEEIFEPETIEK